MDKMPIVSVANQIKLRVYVPKHRRYIREERKRLAGSRAYHLTAGRIPTDIRMYQPGTVLACVFPEPHMSSALLSTITDSFASATTVTESISHNYRTEAAHSFG